MIENLFKAKRRKASPRLVQVKNTQRVSTNMQRVTFTGDALRGFPTDAASANIKLLLPHAEQNLESYIASLNGDGVKPIKRTYTVVEYRESDNELDLDFALHEHAGPATQLALNAKPGDQVGIAGPSQPKLVDLTADWFLIAGDMTAIPAITVNVKLLPNDASGFIVIEIQHESDKQDLPAPENMQVDWLINPNPELGNSALANHVLAKPWREGKPAIWVAGESGCVRQIRSYLAKTRLVDRRHRYTSGYWQIGQDEDSFQMVKRQEPDI